MQKVIRFYFYLAILVLTACGGSGNTPLPSGTNNNQAPIAAADTYTVSLDSSLTVLDNDSDPDGDSFSITSITQPVNGIAAIVDGSQIQVTIDPDYFGSDQLTYTITDSNGASASTAVFLNFQPANTRPQAVNDRVTSQADMVLNIDVLVNDTDANADNLSIQSVGQALHGLVEIQNNTLVYTPDSGYVGEDSFAYTITDGELSAEATVSVVLLQSSTSGNLAPDAVDDEFTVLFETATVFNVLANDSDPENNALSIPKFSAPDHGSIAIVTQSSNGLIVDAIEYTPDANFVGSDSFIYYLSDGNQVSAAVVTVNVVTQAKNSPPLAKDDAVSTGLDIPVQISAFLNDSDPDGDRLSLVRIESPKSGSFSIDNNSTASDFTDDTITYTPNTGFSGTDVIVYTLSDGIEEDRAVINIRVGDNLAATTLVSGSVHKGAVRNSLVSIHLFDTDGNELLDDTVVAATSEIDGLWQVEIPVGLTTYMVSAQGGQFIDESSSNITLLTERTIQLSQEPILQSMWQVGQAHISITPYTSAIIRKARHESSSSFAATINNNRGFSEQALGFDAFSVMPAEPLAPALDANQNSLNYAMFLGGFANVMNAHVIDQGIALPTSELIDGVIDDLSDCEIDGLNFDGPINLSTPVGNKVFTDVTDLNPEIKRFKNNNFTLYPGPEPVFDTNACKQSGRSSDSVIPEISLNPTANGELSNVQLNIGDSYIEPGVTAIDNIDGDISSEVITVITSSNGIIENINTDVSDVYVITYTVVDSSGNRNSINRVVEVKLPILSVTDASITETDAGTVALIFEISLNVSSTQEVSVNVSTQDETAVSISDYEANSQVVTFAPGQTQASFTVLVNGDNLVELDELFSVSLADSLNADIDLLASVATGLIINDDSTSISINGSSVLEGNSGNVDLPFTVTLTQASSQDVSVEYSILDGTATVSDSDYIPLLDSSIIIPAGITSLQFPVSVKGDTKAEADETFLIELSNPVNASLSNNQATGIIVNDDLPVVSIANSELTEGNVGIQIMTYSIALDQASEEIVSVDVGTLDGTALVANSDYVANSETLQFNPGDLTKNFSVIVNGDIDVEEDETLFVALSNSINADIDALNSQATGTIKNDDGVTLAIGDVVITEGNAGTNNIEFLVSLSNPNPLVNVTADFTTIDASAIAGEDYLAVSGSLSIIAGDTSGIITVPIIGDTVVENTESFSLQLSNIVNASFSDSIATATITDNDLPLVTIDTPSVLETDSGQVGLIYTLTLDQPGVTDINIDYSTSDGSALIANSDYVANAGSLLIPAGITSSTITVMVNGDDTVESDENLILNLLNATNAKLASSSSIGTILNDDVSIVSIADSSVLEGTGGVTNLSFDLTLDQLSPVDISVTLTSSDIDAQTGIDYSQISQSVTIPANTLSATVFTNIEADSIVETDETFSVALSSPVNAVLNPAASSAIATIIDDDVSILSINDAQVLESIAINDLVFTVSLDQVSTQDVSFSFETQNGSATDGDYASISLTTLTIPAGNTSVDITVDVLDDDLVEIDETLQVLISSPINASIDSLLSTGTGTILNDDGITISINDNAILEGDSGSQSLEFTVSLSNPSAVDVVTVDYTTVDGSAIANDDYIATSGTLSFPVNNTSQTIAVAINGDIDIERDETFSVVLSKPVNSAIADAIGLATVTNDDLPTISISRPSVPEGNTGTIDLIYTISLNQASSQDVSIQVVPSNGTANLADYLAEIKTLIIPAGSFSVTYRVAVNGDTSVENNETVIVTLSSPSNAKLGAAVGIGTIINDDLPVVSINSPSVIEGDSATSALVFTISLDQVSFQDANVTVTPSDGSASTGDYSASVASLTIPAGSSSIAYAITVIGDTVEELNESVIVTLSSPINANLGTSVGTGTIINDDSVTVVGTATNYIDLNASSVWPGAATEFPTEFTGTTDPIIYVASGEYFTSIEYSGNTLCNGGQCSSFTIIGSLDPSDATNTPVLNPDGSPTTIINMGGVRSSAFDAARMVTLSNMSFTEGVGTNFTNSYCNSEGDNQADGGGLTFANGMTAELDNVWLFNNTVAGDGGGLAICNRNTVVTLSNSVIKDNSASGPNGGGGIWLGSEAALTMNNTRVFSNTSASNGGGLAVLSGSELNVQESVISLNSSVLNGGGLHLNSGQYLRTRGGGSLIDSQHFLKSNILSGNVSLSNGGAISVSDALPGSGQIINNLVLNNLANNGGGFALFNSDALRVNNNSVIYNEASNSGAALYADKSNLDFYNNISKDNIDKNGQNDYSFVNSVTGNCNTNWVEFDEATFCSSQIISGIPIEVAGYYLVQGGVAVNIDTDSPSVNGVDGLTTSRFGNLDTGNTDLGYHYSQAYVGNSDKVNKLESPSANAINTRIVIQPLMGTVPLGEGMAVFYRVISKPVDAVFAKASGARLSFNTNYIPMTDIGNGQYAINLQTGASGTIEIEVWVNPVPLLTVPVLLEPFNY